MKSILTVEELEKAIQWVYDNNKTPYPYLIALRIHHIIGEKLTKDYEAVKGWPEEKEVPKPRKIPSTGHISCSDMNNAMGFNAAVRLCKLAHIKGKPTVEEVEDLIDMYIYRSAVNTLDPYKRKKACSRAIITLLERKY